MKAACWTGFALLALAAIGCGGNPPMQPGVQSNAQKQPDPLDQPAAGFVPQKVEAAHLPNPWRIHPKVISGGLPEGDAAFAELARLGVKTVVSVDGARPDVVTAKRHGIQYVHLPHGYDGVPALRMQELAKVVRDYPGPVFIHCHHGKHRSPAAAAVACVGAGLLAPADAEPVLVAAGTSAGYKGLYESARTARKFESRLLDELASGFPESARLPPFAEAMVALEHTHDHLQQIAAAGWKTPPDHPALEPAHQALLLREHFTEMLRTAHVKEQPEKFQTLLQGSETAAQQLEDALKAWKASGMSGAPPEAAEQAFAAVSASCKSCHVTYRDVPLSEKSRPR
jgi:hypothetical protein